MFLIGEVGSPLAAAPVPRRAAVAVGSILLVVVGGELFTTSVEWVGERLDLDENTTGSVFAALATTLPETLIPVLAILQGSGESIGVGAILGGPVTLTTLAVVLLGGSALFHSVRGTRETRFVVDSRQVHYDLRVFIAGFSVAVLAAFLAGSLVASVVSLLLVALYLWYLHRVRQHDGSDEDMEPEPLEFGRLVDAYRRRRAGNAGEESRGDRPSNRLVAAQTVVAVLSLLVGSHLLVGVIRWVSEAVLSLPAILVALLVVPVVSNLPENVNGVIWVGHGEDTLAVEQLTGTLAFQGTITVAIGALFTPWELSVAWGTVDFLVAASVVIALLGGGLLYHRTAGGGEGVLDRRVFVLTGVLYLGYLGLVAYYLAVGAL